jgi:hypothetical protein
MLEGTRPIADRSSPNQSQEWPRLSIVSLEYQHRVIDGDNFLKKFSKSGQLMRHQKSAIRTSRDGKFKMASLNKRTTTKQKKGFAGVSPGEAHKVGDNLLSR